MITHVNEILDENLYGWRYSATGCNRTAEAIRCCNNEWMTCYYIDGVMLCPNITANNLHNSIAKRRARQYVKRGDLPPNYTPLTMEQKKDANRTRQNRADLDHGETRGRSINDHLHESGEQPDGGCSTDHAEEIHD